MSRLKIIPISDCPFCKMFEGNDATYLSITPLNPVVDGHKLFIPREHVRDFAEDSEVTSRLMKMVVRHQVGYDYNVITSKGSYATQTVPHLHIHLVPRTQDDGLTLPWTGQVKEVANA